MAQKKCVAILPAMLVGQKNLQRFLDNGARRLRMFSDGETSLRGRCCAIL
jgi:hypothetical protein